MSLMLGVAGVIAAAGAKIYRNFTLTYGEDGYTGYDRLGLLADSPIGDIDPETFKDAQVEAVVTSVSNRITVVIDGEVDQDFFHSIKCSLGEYFTADVGGAFAHISGRTWWEWDTSPSASFPASGSESITISAEQ